MYALHPFLHCAIHLNLVQDEDARFNNHQRLLAGPVLVFPSFPPRGVTSPVVLDCGYGTGRWLEDMMGDTGYPDGVVSGYNKRRTILGMFEQASVQREYEGSS